MGNLIPKDLLENIPDLYATEELENPICHIKLFTPDAQWSWYIIEISKEDQSTCYGFVKGMESEPGYFNLEEIKKVRGTLNLPVELDTSFNPTPYSIIKKDS